MMMTRRAMFAGAILLASCAALGAPKTVRKPGGLPRYGMVVFSDLCIHPDNGEFGGQRITLQRFAEVDTVLYEFTAGGLSWPVVASDVTIDPRGQQFYFTVTPPDEDERTISGKFADNGDTLTLDGGYCGQPAVPAKLRRVKDFGRAAPACKPCPAPKAAPQEEGDGQPKVPVMPHEAPVKQAKPDETQA
jgi:hypothetical protein